MSDIGRAPWRQPDNRRQGYGRTEGSLTLQQDSRSGSGDGSLIYVTQESTHFLKGDRLTNDALAQVEGAADIAAGFRVGGTGTFEVDNGGRLSIEGSIGSGQEIALPDGKATLTLANPGGSRA